MESFLGLGLTAYRNSFTTGILPTVTSIRCLNNYKFVKKPFRGVAPSKGKSLDQKLQEHDFRDPKVYYKVNISLPRTIKCRTDLLEKRRAHLKKLKQDSELEKKARENQISLCLEEVTKEWSEESASEHIKRAADHYNIYNDLFEDAFFYPEVNIDVSYKFEDSLVPVCRGNFIKPKQALTAPEVTYNSEPDSLWTLVITNPDGHLEKENSEYLHWLVGNIPGSDISKGSVIANYVQPFPARGLGFQRLVFILYKQNGKMDYSSLTEIADNVDWSHRTFSTYDFYRERQDQLTPAGLAFCQVDWDDSVSRFFHTELDTEEPVYEYDFAPPYYTKQTTFPIKQPFNLYMDRYRDPKQIAKEYILKKLKDRHPFTAPKPALQYPNAVPVYHDLNEKLHGRAPSWLRLVKLKERMGYGRINDY